METSTLYEGRPENCSERLLKEQRCYDMLDRLGISYSRVDHEHADTIEACHEIEKTLEYLVIPRSEVYDYFFSNESF